MAALGQLYDMISTYNIQITTHTGIIFVPFSLIRRNLQQPYEQLMANPSHQVTVSPSIPGTKDALHTTAGTNTSAHGAKLDTPCTANATTPKLPTNSILNPPTHHPIQSPQKHQYPEPHQLNNSIVTPINSQRLAQHLTAISYPQDLTTYLVHGFSQGFRLHHNPSPPCQSVNNNPITNKLPHIVLQKLQTELQLGRIAGPFKEPPFPSFHVSPLSLREKKQKGQYRLIHNLSYPYDHQSVNNNIPDIHKTVHYSTVGDAIRTLLKLPPNPYTAKTDISEAFRLIPIHPSDHSKLGMHFQNQYYYDRCLPQGCASSCHIFEKFSTALQTIFLTYYPQARMIHMLDDFLILAPTQQECQDYLNKFLQLCHHIGVPMSREKTTIPSTNTIFLGIELDTVNRLARLPMDKLQDYVLLIQTHLSDEKITRQDLESLIGKLNFASSVVPARPFLRRLYNLLTPSQKPYYHIKLSLSIKQDLQTWLTFLQHYNGVTYFRALDVITNDSIPMVADACHKGFGAYYGTKWIQCPYPKNWTKFHISVMELYPIYVLVAMFGSQLTNSNILFKTDNTPVRDVINSQTSKNKHIMQIIRPLVLLLIKHNINLKSQHVPGMHNVLADSMSRFQVTPQQLEEHRMQPVPCPIPTHLKPENFKIK